MQYEKKTMTQTQEYGQEKAFLHILTSIREIRQKTFILTVFFEPVVKHNRNKLQYGKSAKTKDYSSRNRPKTLILAILGPLAPVMHNQLGRA